MPQYFFHRIDGNVERDDEGIELSDQRQARLEAVMFAGASLRDDPDLVLDGQPFRVDVTDEMGLLLFTVTALAIDAPVVDGMLSR